ncbi:MAG: 5-deoxy-glucuronate isomerase [Candidatus Reconcilbacillus cellulovorans]|uniref:5-deoxy-glucuronate isomerase n=1 Tax=Candidatus Reconcilbacillus cellulovorans TaxID=1906605 RepID=A0A2A6E1M5_9BACL|nr:MAG: 5-deoxy-glucuronate isomerase [Candidatus Reconcilbacillus cellulovorans]
MADLIVRPAAEPGEDGTVLSVTPESAGWRHVGFRVVRLKPGRSFEQPTGEREYCAVLLSGKADVRTSDGRFNGIGQRMNVFEETPPFSVYIPAEDWFSVTALTELELAVCSAPGKAGFAARLIPPSAVGVEIRGRGHFRRRIHHILPETEPAASLLVVEVYTPNGHWSSYPPHKHDRNAWPDESFLEETYYFRIKPEHGFAVQKVYTEDRSLDETMTVRNGDLVLVPRGYHTVAAPPGYDAYYLNVMAGPRRAWKIHNDPDHAWLLE